MRAVPSICVAACCLALLSCGTFGKKAQLKSKDPPRPAGDPVWPAPADSAGTTAAERPSPAVLGGLLAGRVLDSYDRPPPPTYIQVVAAEAREEKNPSLEVATDNQGYFAIHGLQAGQHYQLIARTRDAEPILAGTTWATPPNPRLLIYVSQDFATPNTPAAPRPPTVPGRNPSTPAAPPPKRSPASTDARGGTSGNANRDPAKPSPGQDPGEGDAAIGPPMRLHPPAPAPSVLPSAVPTQPRSEIRTQDIVGRPEGLARSAPVTSIPAQADLGRAPGAAPPSAAGAPPPEPATQVPSCVLTGKQLHNFAVYDLDGHPWEYRQHQGRVVLLVFWETACVPCQAAIPQLKLLQERYGLSGLEILAIAYEEGSPQEEIRKLRAVRERLGINYRLLLGGAVTSCPVRVQFGVSVFPTLVLLDPHSRIIWRQQGLDPYRLQELEMLIKHELTKR